MKRRDFILGLFVAPFLGKAIIGNEVPGVGGKQVVLDVKKDWFVPPYYLRDVEWYVQHDLLKSGFKGFD